MGDTMNPGVVAVMDAKTAGAIVWWRLSGITDIQELADAWKAAGLSEKLLLPEPTPQCALGRAASELSEKRRLIRPMPGGKGWAVVQEKTDGENLSYETEAKLRVEAKELKVEPDGTELATKARIHFNTFRATFTIADISSFLVGAAKSLKAVALRNTGGIYFIPRDQVETFRRMAGAIKGVSEHVLFEVPALQTNEAVEAILAAVISEAEQEAATMETELDTGDLGERALKTREGKAAEMLAKVESYETLLGRSMEAMKGRIEALKAGIVEATLRTATSVAA